MQRKVSVNNDHEYGLPMVQDDDTIDTMQQITLGQGLFQNTGRGDHNNNAHFSV